MTNPRVAVIVVTSGDDKEAKRGVIDLLNGVGFAAIDLGSLREGGALTKSVRPSLDWTCT